MHDQAATNEHLQRELLALHAISTALSRTLTEEQVAEVVLHETLRAVGADGGAVRRMVSEDRQETICAVDLPAGSPPASELSLDLVLDGPRPAGSLVLAFARPRRVEEAERRLLETIAALCAQALDRARQGRTARRQQQVQRLLAATAGHDLRNPLAAITTTVDVMRRLGPLDEQRERCLEVIASSGQRLKRFISDLADVTVAAGTGVGLRPAPAHLDAVCRPILRQLGGLHADRELRYESKGDGLGRWDPVRLGQAVSNLVSNALRYGAPGSPVELRWDGTATERVWLEVESHGPDIPPEALRELFDPFRRERRASADREGLGVGLFIAEHLVQAHGGSLQARSSDGVTVFRIELPRGA